MDLSIVIPFYKAERYLATCLDSLLSQNLSEHEYEIIIIDDGSPEECLEVPKEYANKFPQIKLVSKTNGGVGSARNKGIDLASGNYIYFIDPDDYLANNVVKLLLETIKLHDLDILTFRSRKTYNSDLFHEQPDLKDIVLTKIINGIDYLATELYQNEVWWYLIKKEFIDSTQLRFIEDRWMEDAIITAQLFTKAKHMAHLPIDAHRHLIVPESAMTSKEPQHYLKIIDDNRNAAMVFDGLISKLETNSENPESIKRLKTRQQSFVFFMMVRMLKSTIKLKDVKATMQEVSKTEAYPLSSFISKDYNNISYRILLLFFNNKNVYYVLFIIFNPVFKLVYTKK
ncbi:glycosyltransferase family 2 protein [Winogradskyella ursingii]|uniref:glycosyltransferase family 2 protein n=1 Tax=Winogradskyella ursingii TaxID=2686079 RepID=UPI0015C71A20|nr:glycosyltransferase [Winogradskyella ursingii]